MLKDCKFDENIFAFFRVMSIYQTRRTKVIICPLDSNDWESVRRIFAAGRHERMNATRRKVFTRFVYVCVLPTTVWFLIVLWTGVLWLIAFYALALCVTLVLLEQNVHKALTDTSDVKNLERSYQHTKGS